jgi:hypothetical protein
MAGYKFGFNIRSEEQAFCEACARVAVAYVALKTYPKPRAPACESTRRLLTPTQDTRSLPSPDEGALMHALMCRHQLPSTMEAH